MLRELICIGSLISGGVCFTAAVLLQETPGVRDTLIVGTGVFLLVALIAILDRK